MLGHATSRLRHQEAHATSLEEIDRLIINITQLTRAEGDILTRSMLHVYLDDTAYAQHVKTFNNAPEQFDFGAYIAFMKEEALSGVER